jgi:hypothetical protein
MVLAKAGIRALERAAGFDSIRTPRMHRSRDHLGINPILVASSVMTASA